VLRAVIDKRASRFESTASARRAVFYTLHVLMQRTWVVFLDSVCAGRALFVGLRFGSGAGRAGCRIPTPFAARQTRRGLHPPRKNVKLCAGEVQPHVVRRVGSQEGELAIAHSMW